MREPIDLCFNEEVRRKLISKLYLQVDQVLVEVDNKLEANVSLICDEGVLGSFRTHLSYKETNRICIYDETLFISFIDRKMLLNTKTGTWGVFANYTYKGWQAQTQVDIRLDVQIT